MDQTEAAGRRYPSEVAEPDLRKAAVLTLDAVPSAVAVLLFGSRARGGAAPESDWDVAIVTRRDDVRTRRYGRTPIEALHPNVNAIFLDADLLRDKRNSPGHIAREVLRDGRLLAGRMPRVGRISNNPPMEPHEFMTKSSTAVSALSEAGIAFATALGEPHGSVLSGSCRDFVRHTADAAEYLAKLMMFRRGVATPRWHGLNRNFRPSQKSKPTVLQARGAHRGACQIWKRSGADCAFSWRFRRW